MSAHNQVGMRLYWLFAGAQVVDVFRSLAGEVVN